MVVACKMNFMWFDLGLWGLKFINIDEHAHIFGLKKLMIFWEMDMDKSEEASIKFWTSIWDGEYI